MEVAPSPPDAAGEAGERGRYRGAGCGLAHGRAAQPWGDGVWADPPASGLTSTVGPMPGRLPNADRHMDWIRRHSSGRLHYGAAGAAPRSGIPAMKRSTFVAATQIVPGIFLFIFLAILSANLPHLGDPPNCYIEPNGDYVFVTAHMPWGARSSFVLADNVNMDVKLDCAAFKRVNSI
jgi:hypothetical protein